MTNFLVKLFIKNADDIKNPAVRSAYGKFAGLVGIICNFILFVLKLAVGILFGSIAITADAINNLSDASSSVVTLIGFKLAEKPADNDHPYGHARIEYLSGLVVSVMILVIGFELVKTSIDKIINPTPVEFTLITLLVLVASILLKLWMSFFNKKLGRLIDSTTLSATSADSQNDVITTGAVLLAALIAHFSGINIDGYAGFAVAIFIIYSGIGIAKDTISPLLGEAPDPALVKYIADKVLAVDGVLGIHDLMVHDYGPQKCFASAHIEMSAAEDVMHSHDIIDTIERRLLKEDNIHLVVHYDPILCDDEEIKQLKNDVLSILKNIDPCITMHDFRTVKGPLHTNLIFDVVVPYSLGIKEGELIKLIDERAKEKNPDYYTVVTVDYASNL